MCNDHLLYVYLHCVQGYIYTWRGMVWKPEVNLGCSSGVSYFAFCILEIGALILLNLPSQVDELANKPRALPASASTVLDYSKHTTTPGIVYLGSGKQTQVLVLANKAFYPLSHLSHLLTPSEPPHFLCVITIFVFFFFLAQRLAFNPN